MSDTMQADKTLEEVDVDLTDLQFAVQYTAVDGSYGRWITMCAFDVEGVAVKYVEDCSRDGRPWKYRAVKIRR